MRTAIALVLGGAAVLLIHAGITDTSPAETLIKAFGGTYKGSHDTAGDRRFGPPSSPTGDGGGFSDPSPSSGGGGGGTGGGW